jgi:hypothetical protein
LQNLETSAIGRAIGALGIGLGKSMATKQEVNAAQARQITPAAEVDPWALADEPQALKVPQCVHGDMRRKTGLSEKDRHSLTAGGCLHRRRGCARM